MSFWQDKVVMITGASSGIGRGLALELARRGAKLGLVARRKEVLDALVNEIGEQAGVANEDDSNVIVVAADVQDRESVQAAADKIRGQFEKIDVLIANAGIGGNDDATRLDAA